MGGTLDVPEPSIVDGGNGRSRGDTLAQEKASHRGKRRNGDEEEEEEAKAVGTGEYERRGDMKEGGT